MQREQKVKVGLIKNAIKSLSAVKLLRVAINQKSQNVLRQQQRGNESVNTFHYCTITREEIKSQRNCYKLDLTCVCPTCDYFTLSANGTRRNTFLFICGGFFFYFVCLFFLQSISRGDLLLMSQVRKKKAKSTVHIHAAAVCTTCRVEQVQETHFSCCFATEDVGGIVAHLQRSCKRRWIRRNKLPAAGLEPASITLNQMRISSFI